MREKKKREVIGRSTGQSIQMCTWSMHLFARHQCQYRERGRIINRKSVHQREKERRGEEQTDRL